MRARWWWLIGAAAGVAAQGVIVVRGAVLATDQFRNQGGFEYVVKVKAADAAGGAGEWLGKAFHAWTYDTVTWTFMTTQTGLEGDTNAGSTSGLWPMRAAPACSAIGELAANPRGAVEVWTGWPFRWAGWAMGPPTSGGAWRTLWCVHLGTLYIPTRVTWLAGGGAVGSVGLGALAGAAAGAGVHWIGGVRRRRRAARGMCGGCGYDLRGAAVVNGACICPECGQSWKKPA